MENFTPIASSIGGALIGLSAGMMLLLNGRIAGISGIFGGLLSPQPGDIDWRLTFVLGMLGTGLVAAAVQPGWFAVEIDRSLPMVALAGLLVGVGTRLGNGCTSGHGVCGLPRLSPRSFVAVGTFMATGALTATGLALLGGA